MRAFDLAKRRLEAGHRLRFYQDFYGRQWVKVQGGWMFWRSRKIDLTGEEILKLKDLVRNRRSLLRDGLVQLPEKQTARTATLNSRAA